MRLPTIPDLGDLGGRSVLLRADLNVPLHDGEVADDTRIREVVPTIAVLVEAGARVNVCSHLGRPKGRPDPAFDMAPVRRRLADLAPGVDLLDNLRFDPREEAGDPALAARLVAGHDVFVSDAFGACHRAHASIVGPPRLLPSAAGLLMLVEAAEILSLRRAPRRPFVVVLGGAKVADKLGVVEAVCSMADIVLVGGAMCFTFLAAAGHDIGASLCDPDHLEDCRALLAAGHPLQLPEDLVGLGPGGRLGEPAAGGAVRQFGANLPDGWLGADIGPGTAASFADTIADAGTVFWNGPLGAFEDPRFAAGTATVAEALAETRAHTVVGGGDSGAALTSMGLARSVSHLSTGGGASLALLEHGDLPGLAVLRASAERFSLPLHEVDERD
ncbi:MAG: phosphoglycerate kinase [Acidimicrobiia bacterium]|nr:phosphoglycerate kinase [Acidimicrobiia bacterium]MYI20244.1 phosphoglycerate kinase [Acidimicrobiia bacterium]